MNLRFRKQSASIVLLSVLGFHCLPGFAAEVKVRDAESARKAVRDARPGNTIVLSEGEWKDVDLRFDGEGTQDHPITIRAERPGGTVITGASRVRLGGSFLVVSGLHFRELSGAKADWFEFRMDSKRRANHCRLTECAFTERTEFVPEEQGHRWIGIYGKSNLVDHCTIGGKKSRGASVVVWLGELDEGGHHILNNHFSGRPRLGENGGETIRIGDSKTSWRTASCLVEGNVFFRCDGEAECISNKSSGNVYRGNWFLETQGTLTLRHGNHCLVEGNFFLGGRRNHTGGIRVIGEGHRVIGNVLHELEGTGFRSAICLVNGLPESPAHGYQRVAGAVIRGNVVRDCRESLLIGFNTLAEATEPPRKVRFENNVIFARDGGTAVRTDRPATEMDWRGNRIVGGIVGMDELKGMRDGSADPIPEPHAPPRRGVGWKMPTGVW